MFRTELHVDPSPWKITLDDAILSMGSCFAVHIGEQLSLNKFDALTNPFGTIFNPLSLFKLIEICLKGEEVPQWSYLQNQGIYRNYLFHSDISALKKDDLVDQIIDKKMEALDYLRKSRVILLTFGTAVYYKLKSTGEVVANCHKVPQKEFEKGMARPDEIEKAFEGLYHQIKSVNPNITFLLSVSPVRHLKDTLEVNSVSKAILRMAVGDLRNKLPGVDYFPSYELMMDDLRDYRFYKEDMLHPNDQAIDYIWKKFVDSYLDDTAKEFVSEWTKISKAMNHRPFYPHSDEHRNFILKTIKSIEQLKRPNLQAEIDQLKVRLHD